MNHGHCTILALVSLLAGCAAPRMGFVRVAPDNKGFILPSNKPFIPWGHNYGISTPEKRGKMDWPRIARDFDDFRKMRANLARVHLQVPQYMDAADKPNPRALAELSHLLKLAERKGIYLDLTGLATSPAAGLGNTPRKPRINSSPCNAPGRSAAARPPISPRSNSSGRSAPRCAARVDA